MIIACGVQSQIFNILKTTIKNMWFSISTPQLVYNSFPLDILKLVIKGCFILLYLTLYMLIKASKG